MIEDDMKLPEGKTAESCGHFKRCSSMFGCKPHYTTCDFAPSRYVEKTPTSNQRKNHADTKTEKH